jgi:hypothetical protein
MGNVLSKEKREQVIALGRLGWSLRRIEQATGVRRETAGDYLRSAGIALRTPGGWGRRPPAKAATSVITGSESSKPAIEVITGFLPEVTLPAGRGVQLLQGVDRGLAKLHGMDALSGGLRGGDCGDGHSCPRQHCGWGPPSGLFAHGLRRPQPHSSSRESYRSILDSNGRMYSVAESDVFNWWFTRSHSQPRYSAGEF